MTDSVSVGGLADHITTWRPPPVGITDTLQPERAHQLAATLDLDEALTDGDALPPLWHWIYFQDWPATAQLGADGHPRSGPFLPPIPHRRRMFAGGRLTQLQPLTLGVPATRVTSLHKTAVKHGRSGEMLFVTVRSEYSQSGQPHVIEEQDLVYRSQEGTPAANPSDSEPLAVEPAQWMSRPAHSSALLFRFSALTANAHRIHYDEAYTTGTEGFPALVVHGPLLALYMAELLRANSTGRTIRSLEFRLSKPVFLGDEFAVLGTPDQNTAQLSVVSARDRIHATAQAEFC